MPTDDERREVAARLRNVEKYAVPGAKIADNPITVDFIAAAAFYDLPYVQGLFARLAELIEPSIPADPGEAGLASVDGFIRERTGKPVDRDVLLELADEMGSADPEDLDIAIDFVTECASRIREALGVWRWS